MRLRLRLRPIVPALVATLLHAGHGRADLPATVCLPPRASSCVTHSKKDPDVRAMVPVLRPTVATLVNLHTREAVALGPDPDADEPEVISRFLRDRTSWELHAVAPACLATIRRACAALGSRRVEIVSGFRSEKLNEMLRKKGRHVAKHSEHSRGEAVDFRLMGIPTRALLRFVRTVHRGGIGSYLGSQFVHVDVGRVRQWRGD
jgi:uncharacterized protein YcbK (DUF882 family)